MLVPEGTSQHVEDLQTRLDLVAGGDWRVVFDDGTMERSAQPLQPVRGSHERLWVVRSHPFTPTDNLQVAASLAVELAGMSQASIAAVGVSGLFAWGFVLVDDFHSLFGLLLLDWLYSPRLGAGGDVLETDDQATLETEMRAKAESFAQLWTLETSQLLMSQLPPGVLQPVESYQALSLLGPGGRFDPRLWQGLVMQLVLPVVQMFSTGAVPGGQTYQSESAPGPSSQPQSSAVAERVPTPAMPSTATPFAAPPAEDGLTPLARAQREADERRLAGEQAAPAALVEDLPEVSGVVYWRDSAEGLVLCFSLERFDADLIRACQGGDFAALARSERPTGQQQELWQEAGSPFVAELPSFARLFLDGVPLHRSAFEAAASEQGDHFVLSCQLQRVCRVQALLVDQGSDARRILVCSDNSISSPEVLRLSSP